MSEGTLVPDPAARLEGRGAYVCQEAECMAEAIRRSGFQRSFRAAVRVPDDHLDWIR